MCFFSRICACSENLLGRLRIPCGRQGVRGRLRVRADLSFQEDYSRADGNDGHWFFVKYESRADKTIFFVDYESRADLKIFFVDYESRAGWRNKSKQHLLY